MITVACVWVRANVAYGPEYVTRLRNMVARHLDRPFRFVCLTNQASELTPGIEAIPIEHNPELPGWWAKLQLFNRAHGFRGRMLYLDLDSIVVANLTPILDYPARFALVGPGGNFQPKGYRTVRRFNSSVMVWNAGEVDDLWDLWMPRVARQLWGDQDWIGEQRPDGCVMPAIWFPRVSELESRAPGVDARVVLCKKPKNAEAAKVHSWIAGAWR